MTTLRILSAALFGVACVLPACHSDRDEADLGEAFQLTPGEGRRVDGYEVRFEGVAMDSRCATDATCFWEGSVELTVGVRTRHKQAQYELGTHFWPTTTTIAPGRRLRFLAIEPAKRSTVRIPPEAYRATFRVEAE